MLEYVKCNLCGADDYNTLAEECILSKEKLQIVKCKKCGLIYTNPRLDAEGLSIVYGEESYAEKTITGASCLDVSVNKNRFYNCLKLLEKCKYKDGKLLDVGCGTGIFLETIAKRKSWHLYGVEPSKYAFKVAHNKFGDNIFNCTLEEAQFKDKSFDVITLWNVLEHVPDPLAVLNEAERILKDDGLLILSVPNVILYQVKRFMVKTGLLSKNNISWHAAEHLYHFTPKTINMLINKTNFVIFKQTLSTPFMIGNWLENFIRGIASMVMRIFFDITKINLGGFELYLRNKSDSVTIVYK